MIAILLESFIIIYIVLKSSLKIDGLESFMNFYQNFGEILIKIHKKWENF